MKPPVGDDGQEPTTEAIRACREYAVQQLDAAKENELYVCGMQPLDPDNLMYGVITARSGIACHDHVEFEYFGNPVQTAAWFDANLCAYCAGVSGLSGFVDEELREEWKSLLPVCQTCRDDGALPLVRTRKRNGAARGKQAQTTRLRESASVQQAAAEAPPSAPPTSGARPTEAVVATGAGAGGSLGTGRQSRRQVERQVMRRSQRSASSANASTQPAAAAPAHRQLRRRVN